MMERRNNTSKRSRDHQSSSASSSSSSSSSSSLSAAAAVSADVRYERSSQLEIGNRKKQHVDGEDRQPAAAAAASQGRLFDLDLSFGVFDFPWLKDSLIYSKSEDWKFEDVFSITSFDGASSTVVDTTAFTESSSLSGKLVWCNLPDPWEEEYEDASPPLDGGGGQTGEGMDCVWNSLLNQPLQQRSSAL